MRTLYSSHPQNPNNLLENYYLLINDDIDKTNHRLLSFVWENESRSLRSLTFLNMGNAKIIFFWCRFFQNFEENYLTLQSFPYMWKSFLLFKNYPQERNAKSSYCITLLCKAIYKVQRDHYYLWELWFLLKSFKSLCIRLWMGNSYSKCSPCINMLLLKCFWLVSSVSQITNSSQLQK